MRRRTPEPPPRQHIVVWLFGVACLAVGLWSFVGIVTDVFYGYWRTRAMVTVEAQLRSVEYHQGSSGGGRGGGAQPSTTVWYDYQVGSQSFTGSRIAIFKQTGGLYAPLSSALQSSTPIRVFIDPKHPEYSVIDREFAWWPTVVLVPFSLVFVGVGFLIFWHCLRTALVRLRLNPTA